MQYQLNIVVDDAGLDYLYSSGQSVILTRTVQANPAPPNPTVLAWVVFAPFEENRVQWDDASYYYYAEEKRGHISFRIQTNNPVQPGLVYTFTDSGVIAGPGTGTAFVGINQLSLSNPSLGLQQSALVNNLKSGSSVNAVPVPFQGMTNQTPLPIVNIFTGSGYREGQTISPVPPNLTPINMSSGFAVAGFDDATKKFVQLQQQAKHAPVRVFA